MDGVPREIGLDLYRTWFYNALESLLTTTQHRWQDVFIEFYAFDPDDFPDFLKLRPSPNLRSLAFGACAYAVSLPIIGLNLENATNLRSLTLIGEALLELDTTPLLPNLTVLKIENPLDHVDGLSIHSLQFFVDFCRLLPNLEHLRIDGDVITRDAENANIPLSAIAAIPFLELPQLVRLELYEGVSARVFLHVINAPRLRLLSCSGSSMCEDNDEVDLSRALARFTVRSKPPLLHLDVSSTPMDEKFLATILAHYPTLQDLSLHYLGLTIKTMQFLSFLTLYRGSDGNGAEGRFGLCPKLVRLDLRGNEAICEPTPSSEPQMISLTSLLLFARWRIGGLKHVMGIHERVLPHIRRAIEGGLGVNGEYPCMCGYLNRRRGSLFWEESSS